MHFNTLVNAVVLERANHFQSGAVTYVSQAWIFVSSEIPLKNTPIFSTVEQRSPGLQLFHAVRCFLSMQLYHPPVIQILSTAQGVCKMHFPAVAVVNVRQCCGDTTFSHYRVGFTQQRFTDQY